MTIEQLVRTWAAAVHAGDLDTVLAHHADDIVMFDVPPPHDGVRGIAAYRETWPPFFEWQASGAVFEIVELDVTEGADVAYVWALLTCGTPDEHAARPDQRLRLTLGPAQAGRCLGGRPTSTTRSATPRTPADLTVAQRARGTSVATRPSLWGLRTK